MPIRKTILFALIAFLLWIVYSLFVILSLLKSIAAGKAETILGLFYKAVGTESGSLTDDDDEPESEALDDILPDWRRHPSNRLPKSSLGQSKTSQESMAAAAVWLQTCDLLPHEECKTSEYLPTRLIEIHGSIENSSGMGLRLRLRLGADLPMGTKYMTLSHCWGGELPFKLLKDKLKSMKSSIDIELLPHTFGDALKVTQTLGIQYLWIDALCIVQDSMEDWTIESGKMGTVYANSYCNISATASTDGSKGLSFPRGRATLQGLQGFRSQRDPSVYRAYNPDDFHNEVNNAPLNRRAWVLQERLLSRRNLHFGQTQLFWECCNMTACETFPKGLPSSARGSDTKRKFAMAFRPSQRHTLNRSKTLNATDEQMHKYWGDMVEVYSKTLLTFPTDRLVAISGLASLFHSTLNSRGMFSHRFGQPDYLSGLWNHDLPAQLLWKFANPRSREESPVYIAPSWSWASVQGELHDLYIPLYQGLRGISKYVITVEDAWIKLVDSLQPFGQVISGGLKVKGKLAITSYVGYDSAEAIKLVSMRDGEDESNYEKLMETISLSWDFLEADVENFLTDGDVVYLLPIRAKANTNSVLASILECLDVPIDFEVRARDSGVAERFRDGYLGGLLLKAVETAKTDGEEEKGDGWVLPGQFRRVGKWETFGIGRFLEEVAFVDKVRGMDRTEDERKKVATKGVYPSYMITIV